MSSLNENTSTSAGESSQDEVPQIEASALSNSIDSESNLHKVDVKKVAAQLLGKYFSQLMKGCGNVSCCNEDCASSGKVGHLTTDQAGAKALQLLKYKAHLCSTKEGLLTTNCNKIDKSQIGKEMDCLLSTGSIVPPVSNSKAGMSDSNSETSSISSKIDRSIGLTEERIESTIKNCQITKNYASLRILLRTIFANDRALKLSFLKPEVTHSVTPNVNELRDSVERQIGNKEELRASEMDLDKDVDSLEDKYMMDVDSQPSPVTPIQLVPLQSECLQLDLESLKRSYDVLYKVPESEFNSTLMDAIRQLLKDSLAIQLKVSSNSFKNDPLISNIFIILLENPSINSVDYTEDVLGELCKVMAQLGVDQQVTLTHHISKWETSNLIKLLQSLHQLITIQILTNDFTREFTINDEDTITSATRVMKIIYYASILKGQLDYPLLNDLFSNASNPVRDSNNTIGKTISLGKGPSWDPLAKALKIHPLDARLPAIPFEEFYDDFLSDQLEMDRDFAYYKAGATEHFSFLSYPFILNPATKALGLYYDNRIRMYSERRMSVYHTIMAGTQINPYLNLRIRRDHIIEDTLIELELIAMDNPSDLKKQLIVEFSGEQGIDEGGVSKEFFQLIIEQIFNPDYAMFCLNQDTQTFWFNPTSFENEAQFTLVGVVLGLAIYNNIILDVHFPAVMYKKICGKQGSYHDLKDWNVVLYNSLKHLLDYEGDDMGDIFMQTFRVGYQDIFGGSIHHDLKQGGDNILVNQQNKQEFVDMYADFLLNKSVLIQFNAFKKGFSMVTDDSPLLHLFRPDELELLVCGSQEYDFLELRKSTEYDGGYTTDSPIINWFWDLVDRISSDEKKQLLQFTTGSARVPVGGLARLKLVIARHGPDSDRLPTAHTCFNVLLLPDYATKEKLTERLLKAIKYAQGFGML